MDLGLPSGLKWCTHNVGASSAEAVGYYFSWGNVTPRTIGVAETYKNTPGAALTGDIPVNSTYDAARAIMGGSWRMPTRLEQTELINNCNFSWESVNGVNGAMLTSKTNGNTIFLPCTGRIIQDGSLSDSSMGFYWSSTYGTSVLAYCFNFNNNGIGMNDWHRFYGNLIRPVKDA